jgi:hypothetical protein
MFENVHENDREKRKTKCVEGANVGTARRTVHITYMFLESITVPPPPQTTCSGGRPIAPTAMWERATGRFESPAATSGFFLSVCV